MLDNGLRITHAEIKNFKNIAWKEVDFDGKSVVIIGPNNIGKSSFLQAIMSPVDANFIPAKPIKKGETKGHIELKLAGNMGGELKTYNVGLYFSEQNQKGRLTIETGDGGKVGNTRMIMDSLVGAIGFDVMDFLDMGVTKTGKVSKDGVRQQIEILKSFMPFDICEAFKDLEEEAATVFTDRTEKNREINDINGQISDIELSQEEIDTYGVEKDAEVVTAKISELSAEVEKWNRADAARVKYADEMAEMGMLEAELKERLAETKRAFELARKNLEKTEAWLEDNSEKPSIDSLTTELNEINAHNKIHERIMVLEEKQVSIAGLQKESDQKTNRLKSIQEEKVELFADNPLPVKDLVFDEDQILYKGLPFNKDQHSTSVLIGVGVRLAMAMNPNLKVLTIQDGSLLDKKTMNFILKLCNEEGYQILIEKVKEEGDALEIEFIES